MASLVEAGRGVLVERDHQRSHHRQGGAKRLFVELADGASSPCGEVVRRLAVQLGLAGTDQVHGARNRAHQAADVRERDVEHLFQRQRGVHGGGKRQEQVGTVSRAGLVGQRGFQLAGGAPLPHERQGQQHETGDQQHRDDEQYAGRFHLKSPDRLTRRYVTWFYTRPDLEPLSFDDLPLGGEWTTRRRTVSEAEIALFAGVAGDLSPLTIEADGDGRRTAPPALIVAMAVGLGSVDMPVPSVAEWEWLNWKFPRAVHAGDTIYTHWMLTQKRPPVGGAPSSIVVWRVDVHTSDGTLCAEGEIGAKVRRAAARAPERAPEGAPTPAAGPRRPRRRSRPPNRGLPQPPAGGPPPPRAAQPERAA